MVRRNNLKLFPSQNTHTRTVSHAFYNMKRWNFQFFNGHYFFGDSHSCTHTNSLFLSLCLSVYICMYLFPKTTIKQNWKLVPIETSYVYLLTIMYCVKWERFFVAVVLVPLFISFQLSLLLTECFAVIYFSGCIESMGKMIWVRKMQYNISIYIYIYLSPILRVCCNPETIWACVRNQDWS